jgi:hypothetical protein
MGEWWLRRGGGGKGVLVAYGEGGGSECPFWRGSMGLPS